MSRVLGQGLFQAALAEQRVVAGELDDLAQVGDRLGEPAVVGDQLDFLVEGLVGLEEAVDVLVGGGALQVVVDAAQAGEVFLGGLVGGVGGALAFQQRQHREDLVQIALRNLRHVAAAAWLERHQTLGGEHLQRFAQWRAGDAVVGRQGLLIDPGARGEFVGKDALAQAFGDFLVEGEGGRCGPAFMEDVDLWVDEVDSGIASIIMDKVLSRG